jgi:hypothetical protein
MAIALGISYRCLFSMRMKTRAPQQKSNNLYMALLSCYLQRALFLIIFNIKNSSIC